MASQGHNDSTHKCFTYFTTSPNTVANVKSNDVGQVHWWKLFPCSDDRSPDIFKTRIEAATQMKSVLQEDRRPNCLIIDEIDGAPQVNLQKKSNPERLDVDVIAPQCP